MRTSGATYRRGAANHHICLGCAGVTRVRHSGDLHHRQAGLGMSVVARSNCAEGRRRGGCVMNEPVKGDELASVYHARLNGFWYSCEESEPLSVKYFVETNQMK